MTSDQERDQEDMVTVHAVLSGDRNAFRDLVERYQPSVTAIGRRTIRLQEDLKDFVQDVFVKAYTHLDQFAGRGSFRAWLMRIAYTTAINRNQRAIPEVPTDPEILEHLWHSPKSQEPEPATMRSLLWEAMIRAIEDLPKHLALSVELFFVLGLRYAEITMITGVPVNTLKSHVHRARTILQERMGPSMLEDHDDL